MKGISWLWSLRAALAGSAFAALLLLPGCLTDGSIPVGGGPGTGVLRGTVVHAEEPDLPFPGARITLRSPSGLILTQQSDPQGHWEFANVPDGLLDVTFEGAQPGVFLPVRVQVHTEYASFATVAAALEPAHHAIADVSAIAISPSPAIVPVGGRTSFTAQITGGDPQRKVPTWVVEGGIGSINALGEFQAQSAGAGTVRAIVGAVSGSAPVSVTVVEEGGRKR